MSNFIGCRKYPIIYLNMPKVGCTSIKNWMYKLDYGEFYKSPIDFHDVEAAKLIHYQTNRSEMEDRFHTAFAFTFVRHPLKRSYSAFCEKVQTPGPRHFPDVRAFVQKHYGAILPETPTLEQHRSDFKAFLHFVRDTHLRRIDFRSDYHWAPQTESINDGLRRRSIDFIGRIENLDEDFAYVCKRAGLEPEPLPRFNEGPKPPFRYDEVLTDEIRDLGLVIYAEDLRNFAYKL